MVKQGHDPGKIARLRSQLLEWYAHSGRDLPWRRNTDPYAIWVSEIMLQQTRVAAVVDRYQAFLARFPTLRATEPPRNPRQRRILVRKSHRSSRRQSAHMKMPKPGEARDTVAA